MHEFDNELGPDNLATLLHFSVPVIVIVVVRCARIGLEDSA